MASGAGLNRWGPAGGFPFFFANGKSSPQTLGANGSVDSGIIAGEAIGFSKWAFQMSQIGSTAATGYSATLYGTVDPLAYTLWQRTNQATLQNNPSTVFPSSSWFKLPAPSEQTGTGVSTNPITALGVVMVYNLSPLVAVRCVLSAVGTPTGTVQIYGFGIP